MTAKLLLVSSSALTLLLHRRLVVPHVIHHGITDILLSPPETWMLPVMHLHSLLTVSLTLCVHEGHRSRKRKSLFPFICLCIAYYGMLSPS